jgi:type I restriction enzyme S subunit
MSLRYLADVATGSGDTIDADPNGDFPFIVRSDAPRASSTYTFDTEAILTAGDGAVGEIFHHMKGKFHAHQRVYVLHRFRDVHPRFFYYYFSALFRRMCNDGSARTTVDSVRRWMITDMPVAVPPADEQRAIADYLDDATAKIDTLIAKQVQMVGLLEERRVVVRSVLATRGGDSTPDLVEKGPEWAVWRPRLWQTRPLTSVARLESGHTPSRTRPELWTDCEVPWISLQDVSAMTGEEFISETVVKISHAGIAASSARILPAGTVVVSRDATVGRSAIMEVEMATSQHFADWVCGPLLEPRYLWLLFTSAMQTHFDTLTDGSTIRTIGMGDLRALKIPLPPIAEQRRIVEIAAEQTSKIDALIAKTREHMALAKERRSALVTAAVTGQIDVRTATRRGA